MRLKTKPLLARVCAISDELGAIYPAIRVVTLNVDLEPLGKKRRVQLITDVAERTRHPGPTA